MKTTRDGSSRRPLGATTPAWMRPAPACALVAVAAAGLVLGATARPAWAHSFLVASSPPNGAVLTTAPRSVELEFTDPPDVALATLRLLDARHRPVASLPPEAVPGQARAIRAPLPRLGRGVYIVAWTAVSRTDGHLTGGAFGFGIGVSGALVAGVAGAPGGAVATSSAPPSVAAVAGTWGLDAGLAVLFAAAVTSLLVFRRPTEIQPRPVWIGAALAVAGLVALALAERASVGVSLARLVTSSAGAGLNREAAAVAAAVVGALLVIVRPTAVRVGALGVIAAGALAARAAAGHAAATDRPLSALNVAVQWLHLLGVAVWVGGLLWLVLGIRRLDPADRAAAVRRFSWLAGIALGVVAFTGLARALDEIGLPGLWRLALHTSYGVTLAVKLALVAVLVGLGTANRFVHLPAVEGAGGLVGRLRPTAIAEIAVGAAVVVASSVLAGLPPAAHAAEAARGRVSVNGVDRTGAVRATLVAVPGRVGPGSFTVRATSVPSGTPVRATRVALEFSLPGVPELGTPSLELRKGREG